ncbi:MAG: hypothetical protein Q7T79_02390 [bacterium]|nr:hypothetical protein [bacterium]
MEKTEEKISNYLKKASFSNYESKIIEYVVDNGYGSITLFSKYLGVARASIYKLVKILSKRGILNTVKKGKRTFFEMNNDFNLLEIYENVYKKLEKIKKIRLNSKQKNFFLPKDIHSFLEIALQMKRGEIIYSIETSEDVKFLFEDKEWNLKWQEKASRKGIVLKGIGTIGGVKFFEQGKIIGTLLEILKKRSGSARILPNELNFPLSIVSFKNFTGFFSRSKDILYTIHDENIAKTIQAILDFVYEQSNYKNI